LRGFHTITFSSEALKNLTRGHVNKTSRCRREKIELPLSIQKNLIIEVKNAKQDIIVNFYKRNSSIFPYSIDETVKTLGTSSKLFQ